ncbi:hypothetical protein J4Q44_G00283840 [Coregonus suidteri]|uniref:ERO1-like protein beta n=1 Tax=Coregonus suidteri TaxID=861788 RepID=A0AAN8LCX7_9TELE
MICRCFVLGVRGHLVEKPGVRGVKTKTYNNQYSSKEDAPDSQDQSCFCHLTGVLDDCFCDIESIDVFNNFKIYPRIQKLTERDYFRYYRVNLNRPCPFWADDGHCSIKDCQVEPCPESKIPVGIKSGNYNRYSQVANANTDIVDCEQAQDLGAINSTLSNYSKEAFEDWARHDDAQDHFCELDGATLVLEFRQRFDPAETKGEGTRRLKNLYFLYLIELRALSKVAPYFDRAFVNLYTGDLQEDRATKELLLQFFNETKAFPMHFDEKSMFAGQKIEAKTLKEEFRLHFKNISRIMDCVGCSKCRLWGKLQTQGLGTALKILFSEKEIKNLPEHSPSKGFQLTRQDIVALLNGFGRLSTSIHQLHRFRALLKEKR